MNQILRCDSLRRRARCRALSFPLGITRCVLARKFFLQSLHKVEKILYWESLLCHYKKNLSVAGILTSCLVNNAYIFCVLQDDLETYGVDPTASFHDGSDDTPSNEVVVPPTLCPLDANALNVFKEKMSTVQGQDSWDIMPYLHAVENMNLLKT